MKVNVLSRKLIKPCTQTPSDLRTFKISVIDEINPAMNVIRILYYPSDAVKGKNISLEEPLSKVLPLFYPIAGRYIKEKHIVDCNDEGAEYVEAEVNCELLQLISPAQVMVEHLNHLLPLPIGAADEPEDPMLAVQINRFQCGGLAIGICASHRIFDSCSLGIFLKAWANAAIDGGLVICPDFNSPLYFPSENLASLQYGVTRTRNNSIIAKRFVFDKNAISTLRERMDPVWRGERPPSRAAVVSALLTQALMRADRAKHGKTRASIIGQAINVRERTVPPISKYACGAWYSMSYIESSADECRVLEHDYQGMVFKMREVTMQGVKDCERILSDKEFGRWLLVYSETEVAEKTYSFDVKSISVTDWSKFGEYELDFGFGKPIWVSLAEVPLEDFFILMNTKDNDGIEAWVYLHESDMPYFDQDEHLIKLIHTTDRVFE
ncbi:hypothetical protein BUALT_Bualt14G0003600 [Buddleja alternifolia]|uniref:Uncharacterized protein n=1 Tax=Buddleja alternifolia TaxID=168488 RepID=A0AAV6WNC9_9LAMI|nr:hypothetical protein BUALT_Bualt14G0003600 [Buddleja alternifolia]